MPFDGKIFHVRVTEGYQGFDSQYVNIEFLDGELAGVTIKAELPEFKTVED